ncbi:kinesin-like protein KIN-12E [Diospyros lotus]|uniref:kinesin-like protein KIN-12E n=1 Tax=Diospyros lotus TaxID=55363 RepID=UPI002255FB5D|nr:kinesin-like protein KIN-12E [Diospyros lotus]
MPLISETPSAVKSRFGFQDQSSELLPHSRSSPELLKSAARDNISQSSAVRIFNDKGDHCAGVVNQRFELSEDPSFWKDHNVQVIIRIRPLSSSEISLQGYSKCIRQDSCQTVTWIGHPESRFTFDVVADENVSQEMLFKVAGVPMVENCMGGYNSCMFAYGQTGSGKTHTMLGDIEGGTRRHSVNCGMTPRVFEYLFSRIQKEKEARREEKLKFTCKCSFLEIYNEQILDLLNPSSTNLQIREDTKKGVYVENLTEVEVTSARDVIQQLVQGAANRKVAATNMNHASSRSHSVFTCVIESKWDSQGVTHYRFARLNLVDLAGSERQKSSGAEGERLKEATNINKSLSTLGLVIMNLVNISNGKSLHVPYRDSKLTFLLQDSLGGNSKTIIIANISPSSCCSLETLSTLKFAQRAKFIKNHAIVNEDASGDVLAMRLQIQQLKKEVSRLRALVNGGAENHETDAWTVSFPGSPGSFNWEGLHGSFSPLVSGKKASQKKEYEVALVGAFRREKDKEIALQALTDENKAAMQLAKQREDEIQSLKMRLRFREAGIKRLEAVAAGKISAESHLLMEKDELLKEIEVLRAQVDRNQEVTRFAMENLRLKEEIRRLKSFCEEGERERMNEQIMTLQNKLLEALDWKLMHESDPSFVQKGNSETATHTQSECNLLVSSQEPGSPWRASINEENEFLRLQAIQNQSEIDMLHKKLNSCLEEKDRLERHVSDLVAEQETERSSKVHNGELQELMIEPPSITADQMPNISLNDQIELKAMVDAIAAASQREAEAHETAIILSKENDELRMKLKVLIEDNNKLIELYERAVSEKNSINDGVVQNGNHFSEFAEEQQVTRLQVENLEHQLSEMHEENEKLMGLYEKAMQERDEFKRMLSSGGQSITAIKREFNCPEKLVEVDGGPDEYLGSQAAISSREDIESQLQDEGESLELEKTVGSGEDALLEGVNVTALDVENSSCQCPGHSRGRDSVDLDEPLACIEVNSEQCPQVKMESTMLGKLTLSDEDNIIDEGIGVSTLDLQQQSCLCYENPQADVGNQIDVQIHSTLENNSLDLTMVNVSDDLDLVRMKLDGVEEKLLISAETISLFGLLEKVIAEVDNLSRETEVIEDAIQMKQQEYASLKLLSCELHERRALINRKLVAVKCSLSNFSSSLSYFELREAKARARVNASLSSLDRKTVELANLQIRKNEIEDAQRKCQQLEIELMNNLAHLNTKIEEENQRRDNEKVLLAIDNLKGTDVPLHRNWHFSSKATELLKSEEDKTKVQAEIKQAQEKLGVTRKECEDLNWKLCKVENEVQVVQMDLQKGQKSMEEMECKLQAVIQEKQMLLEMKENGRTEVENMILEYHQHTFEADLKEQEVNILDEELQIQFHQVAELQKAKAAATEKKNQLLQATQSKSCWEAIQDIRMSVMELKSLLGDDS